MLQSHSILKDLSRLHYFLRIEVSWTKDGCLHLSQTKYTKDLLQKTGMASSKSQPIPMVSFIHLNQDGTMTVQDVSVCSWFIILFSHY